VAVNETVEEMPLHLSIEPLHAMKFAIMVQMEQSFSMQEKWGMSNSGEADEVKRIFLEGNPIFLALTVAVSLLHSVFDVLAFKNDVAFWKDNKSMKGKGDEGCAGRMPLRPVEYDSLKCNPTS
jgi:hypothetical protein